MKQLTQLTVCTFEELAQLPAMQRLYVKAIEHADIWTHIKTLDAAGKLERDLEALDLGGGTGILGAHLQQQFGPFVNYTNIDTDEEALARSPGTRIAADYTNAHTLGDKRFDYVFLLNQTKPKADLSQQAMKQMYHDQGTEGLFGSSIVFDVERAMEGVGALHSYLLLMNAALMTAVGGRFIVGGVLPKKVLVLTGKVLAEHGFRQQQVEDIGLPIEAARLFVGFDAGKQLKPRMLEQMAQVYSQNFRLAVFDKVRPTNETALLRGIAGAVNQLSETYRFLQVQEQFWG